MAPRLVWDQSWQVEQFGGERDLTLGGIKPEGVEPLIQAIRDNLDHLNSLRGEVLLRSRATADAMVTLQRNE
jgi:hypothetical protein